MKVDGKTSKDKTKRVLYMWLSNDFELSAPQFMTILETIQEGGSEGMREMYTYLNHENIQSGLDEHGFPVKIEIPIRLSITAKVQFSNFKYLNNRSHGSVLPNDCD
jgi:hypothetical protein